MPNRTSRAARAAPAGGGKSQASKKGSRKERQGREKSRAPAVGRAKPKPGSKTAGSKKCADTGRAAARAVATSDSSQYDYYSCYSSEDERPAVGGAAAEPPSYADTDAARSMCARGLKRLAPGHFARSRTPPPLDIAEEGSASGAPVQLTPAVGGRSVSVGGAAAPVEVTPAVGGKTSASDSEDDPNTPWRRHRLRPPCRSRSRDDSRSPHRRPILILRPAPLPAPPPAPPPAPLAVGSPAPPPPPPWCHPPPAPETKSLFNFPGGFLFGINYPLDTEGPLVCGRYIAARKELQRTGSPFLYTWLPEVFRAGGRPRPCKGVWGWRDGRVHSVMGLVQLHEGEYRRWHPNWWHPNVSGWGTSAFVDEDWKKILQPDLAGQLGADHPLLSHHQLQLSPITSSPGSDLQSARQMAMSGSESGSTIVRRSAGQPLAAEYEARNVFITNLPEVLLLHLHTRTAALVYEEWLQCEVIIGKRPRRGHA